ncbi:MAG: hypothetical protein AAF677_05695 [Pseudomonadota bacterium]
MSMLRRLAILPPVLLGAAMVWFAAHTQPSPPVLTVQERRVPVSYVTVAPRTVAPHITGFGTVEPARVWAAVAQVSGPVSYVHPAFVRGGFVARGEVLVRIAPDDYALALESADAELKGAEARVQELQASARTTQASLAIEREMLALAETDLARTRRLAASGTVSDTVVDERRREMLAQRAQVQTLENTLALLPVQIEALQQTAAAAAVAREAAALDLSRTVAVAPFDARVSRVDVEISQFVSAGATMGTLDDARLAEIDVQMPQVRATELARLGAAAHAAAATDGAVLGRAEDAQPDPGSLVRPVPGAPSAEPAETPPTARERLHPIAAPMRAGAGAGRGQGGPLRMTAQVGLTQGPGTVPWPAEVSRISDTVDPQTRSVGVIVRVAEPYGSVSPDGTPRPPLIKGTFVRVTLQAPPVPGVILLPRAAVRDGRVMLVGPDDRLAYASVEPLLALDGVAVLAPGALPAGTRVVTSDPTPALEGLLLAAQPDAAAEARLNAAAHRGTP